MPRLKAIAVLSLATLCASAYAQTGQNANPAVPGTLNYVEGQVSLDGQPLSQRAIGQAQVAPGQVLQTGNGKAEMLLTPGVYVRLGSNSEIRMVSPDLTSTVVALDQGRADVEVDQLYKQNRIVIDQKGGQTLLEQSGLYAFNAGDHTLEVFSGKAAVFEGTPREPTAPGAPAMLPNEKPVTVKGGHELALNGEAARPTSFQKNAAEDNLYNWSSLRSEYQGQANVNLAYEYASAPGFYPGWFWDAGLYGYTWLPGGGPFFSPFGWGFYSPLYIRGGGAVYGYGLNGYRGVGAVRGASVARSGFAGGGFHGGGFGGMRGGGRR